MISVTRRNLLATSAAAMAVTAATTGAAANPARRPGANLLTTITLVNTSANATDPGTVTQLIGCPFKKGDIAQGTWPQFQLADGTAVRCTILNRLASTWSDGSLKFVPVMLSIPESVAENGTMTVNVSSGGQMPPPSPRKLSDFRNSIDPQVQVDGLDNLEGTWVMNLKKAIKAHTKIVSYGNGAAGAVWKVRANAQQNGANHGQLVCDFYIASLANPDGSLKGLRILGKVKLPYYDTTATMNWMSFSRFQLCSNSQGTLIRDCFGENFGSNRAYTFIWQSGAVFDANSGYSTANYGDYGFCTRLSTTGTLPAGLSAGVSYFTGNVTSTTIGFSTCASVPSAYLVSATDAGSGTQTATPYPYLVYFGALFTAGPTGMWDFVQGAGTDSDDTPLRFQVDQQYWVSTGLIPSYDITVQAANNSPTSYWPNCSEPVTRYLDTTGDRDDLGICPAWYARHFLTQAAVDEQVVRIVSLIGGHAFSIGLESSATLSFPAVNNGSNSKGASYRGMPSPNPNFVWAPQGGLTTSGFTDTTNPMVQLAGFGMQNSTHMPQFNYYPYLFTGEPWHLDCLLEHANNAVYQRYSNLGTAVISKTSYALGNLNDGGGERTLQVPSSPWHYGNTIGCNASSDRGDAWASALVAAAAGIGPDKNPDCVSYKKYFNDINSGTWQAASEIIRALPRFAAKAGLWNVPYGQSYYFADSWQLGYLGAAIALALTATEDANALHALDTHVKYFDFVSAQFGGWHVGSYMAVIKMSDDAGAALVTGSDHIAFCGPNITWNVGGPFILTPFSNYTPSDGDVIVFADTTDANSFVTPAGYSKYKPYYMIDLGNNTFYLSHKPGGSPLSITDSYDGSDPFYIVSTTPPSTGSIAAIGDPASYNSIALGMLNYAVAAGARVSSATIVDLAYRNQQAGTNYATDPKWAFTNTFVQSRARRPRYSRRFTGPQRQGLR
ncbi:MAG TPA: hypothetical protein VHX61_20255 [Rhizomicrobium sp.]|jgi:hypothetical protein|nr:hypothetical protein [Rhizomicrobium sp.]